MSKKGDFIGFPEGRLREKPVRLAVLENRTDWFAVNKLAGILPQAHPWYPDQPNLTFAIREQIEAGKKELQRFGISKCLHVCGAECEFSGPSLFAKTHGGASRLRNAFGSNQIGFRYLLFTRSRLSCSKLSCNLPVGQHRIHPRSVVTHRYGKKSDTRFLQLGEAEGVYLWEAFTVHPRLHQVRLHASELGIPVLGDKWYGAVQNSAAESRSGNSHLAMGYPGLGMVLHSLDLSKVHSCGPPLKGSLPKRFASLAKKCGFEDAE